MKSASDLADPSDSRQKLIRAAMELFSNKGFHAVSVREVCEKAHVNVSLISYYFTGKEGLLGAVIEELTKGSAPQVETLIQKFDSRQDFEARLRNFLNGIIQFYLDNSSLMRLFLEELEKEQSEAEKVFSLTFYRTFEAFKRFLRNGLNAGYLRATTKDDTVLLVLVLGPFLNLMRSGHCTLKFYESSLADSQFRNDLIDQMVQLILVSE